MVKTPLRINKLADFRRFACLKGLPNAAVPIRQDNIQLTAARKVFQAEKSYPVTALTCVAALKMWNLKN